MQYIFHKNKELNWEATFPPLYGNLIPLPENLIMWRGYDPQYPDPTTTQRPSFFGSEKTASGYIEGQPNKILKQFITIKPLKLIDIRYLKILLTNLLQENVKKLKTKSDINMVKTLIISFGIGTLKNQIDAIKNVYPEEIVRQFPGFNSLQEYYESMKSQTENIFIEPEGVRIAETNIDAYSSTLVKVLFEDICDGIISPRLFSPFHKEKDNTMSPEILLFNPSSCIKQYQESESKKNIISIHEILGSTYYLYHTKSYSDFNPYIFYLSKENFKKGGSNKKNTIEEYNDKLDRNEKDAVKIYNNTIKIGESWKKKGIRITAAEPRTPQYKIALNF